MSSNKSLAFAICLAVTGCAQTPQNGSADAGAHWWSFGSGSDKVADAKTAPAVAKAPTAPASAAAPAAKAADAAASVAKTDAAAAAPAAQADSGTHWYWPFASSDSSSAKPDVAKADAAKADVAKATPAVAQTDSSGPSWWPFGKKDAAPAVAAAPKAIPMPDPKITQAWLDDYEPRLRAAIKDSPFQLERRDDLLVITAPVDSSFNPNRPALLMPNTLGPITRLAKIVEADPKTAVLVLGHADSVGAVDVNQQISLQRAQSVAAIFRLSGLERNRLSLRGMGDVMPRAANDSVQGRALNRRVEILMTPQVTMIALMSKYSIPPTAAPTLLATAQEVKPAPAPVAAPAKKAAAHKAPVHKAAPAKKATPAKKVAPAKAAAPAKPATTTDQASTN